MEQRVSLITLGVRDRDRARSFYEALGWKASVAVEDVVFFQAGGMVLGLWTRERLAHDTRLEDQGGWGGVTLAYNTRSRAEVDSVLGAVQTAGGEVLRCAEETPWGGYGGVFADTEGHAWEVAHNPGWTINPDGSISLPGG